jgi:hypothetical protein
MQQLLQRKLFVVCSNAAGMPFYNLATFLFFTLGDIGDKKYHYPPRRRPQAFRCIAVDLWPGHHCRV